MFDRHAVLLSYGHRHTHNDTDHVSDRFTDNISDEFTYNFSDEFTYFDYRVTNQSSHCGLLPIHAANKWEV